MRSSSIHRSIRLWQRLLVVVVVAAAVAVVAPAGKLRWPSLPRHSAFSALPLRR